MTDDQVKIFFENKTFKHFFAVKLRFIEMYCKVRPSKVVVALAVVGCCRFFPLFLWVVLLSHPLALGWCCFLLPPLGGGAVPNIVL